eukprot:UN07815
MHNAPKKLCQSRDISDFHDIKEKLSFGLGEHTPNTTKKFQPNIIPNAPRKSIHEPQDLSSTEERLVFRRLHCMDATKKKSYITRNNMDEFDNIHEKLEFWDPVSHRNNSKRKT